VEDLIPLVVTKLNLALADFSGTEVEQFLHLLVKLNGRLHSVLDSQSADS
jgi:hypothetical protein